MATTDWLQSLRNMLYGVRYILTDGAGPITERTTMDVLSPLSAADDSVNENTELSIDTASLAGSGVMPATTATTVLTASGAGTPTWAKLTNAYVDAAAAIDGTKISPAFGAQNVTTSGNITITGGYLQGQWVNVSYGSGSGQLIPGGVSTELVLTSGDGDLWLNAIVGSDVVLMVDDTAVVTVAAGLVTFAQPLSFGANPATAGDVRVSSGWSLQGMDVAPLGVVKILQWLGTDKIQIGDNDADLEGVVIGVPTGKSIDLQAAGNSVLSCTDNLATVQGLVCTPSSDFPIAAATGITAAMLRTTIVRVVGDGGAIDITADPQIAAGTDGQVIIVQGTSVANNVKFDAGTGLLLTASATLALNDNLTLMYDSGESLWIELSRSIFP